jgi:hypothetical protein
MTEFFQHLVLFALLVLNRQKERNRKTNLKPTSYEKDFKKPL